MTEIEFVESVQKLQLENGDLVMIRVPRERMSEVARTIHAATRNLPVDDSNDLPGRIILCAPGDEVGRFSEDQMERCGWIRVAVGAKPTIDEIVGRLSAEWGYLPAPERRRLSGELQQVMNAALERGGPECGTEPLRERYLLRDDFNQALRERDEANDRAALFQKRLNAMGPWTSDANGFPRAPEKTYPLGKADGLMAATGPGPDPDPFAIPTPEQANLERFKAAWEKLNSRPHQRLALGLAPAAASSPGSVCETCGRPYCSALQSLVRGTVIPSRLTSAAALAETLHRHASRVWDVTIEVAPDPLQRMIVIRARHKTDGVLAVVHLMDVDLASGRVDPVCGLEALAKAVPPRDER